MFSGPALFVASTFFGLFIGTFVFGFVADKYGRRAIFTFSMLAYCAATLVMPVVAGVEDFHALIIREIGADGFDIVDAPEDCYAPGCGEVRSDFFVGHGALRR